MVDPERKKEGVGNIYPLKIEPSAFKKIVGFGEKVVIIQIHQNTTIDIFWSWMGTWTFKEGPSTSLADTQRTFGPEGVLVNPGEKPTKDDLFPTDKEKLVLEIDIAAKRIQVDSVNGI